MKMIRSRLRIGLCGLRILEEAGAGGTAICAAVEINSMLTPITLDPYNLIAQRLLHRWVSGLATTYR